MALLAAAIISAALLVWPLINRKPYVLSVLEATQLINKHNAIIIDLRVSEIFEKGHLPQSRHYEFSTLSENIKQIAKNKAQPLLLVDENGRNAMHAYKLLIQAGYTAVNLLNGGIDAWQRADMPLTHKGAK